MHFLEVNNLSGGYSNKLIFKDISFNLDKTQILGIIGPNGSGKTTILKTLAGILKPLSGEILINKLNLPSLPKKQIAKIIAYIGAEKHNFHFPLTAYQYIALGRTPYQNWLGIMTLKDKQIIEECMELTQTKHLKHRLYNNLSSGEKQLVNLTRALTQEPLLILLDEPTVHLDLKHQVLFMNLLNFLANEKNISVITVIHDLNLASKFCNKVIFIQDGKILKQGNPLDVLEKKFIESVYNIQCSGVY